MHSDLDQALCRQSPEPFINRPLPPKDFPMGRGFECGDGWFHLIACLCKSLNMAVTQGEMPPIVVTQVKEKFGSLRFR